MTNKILIVEDNQYKREKIIAVISEHYKDMIVTESHSFTSGWQEAKKGIYDLICLDMSLPTFDKSKVSGGGEFRPFGGKELARKIKRRNIDSKFIVITQYKNFSDDNSSSTFESLRSELFSDYSDYCLSVIFYSNKTSDWKLELLKIVKGINN